MNLTTTPAQSKATIKQNELIVTIPTHILFNHYPAWHGITACNPEIMQLIFDQKYIMQRHIAETDINFKQIIPYVIIMHEKNLFLIERKQNCSEQRLSNKLSIGVGGHLHENDMKINDCTAWAQREIKEEVNLGKIKNFQPIGILNDDSNSVGTVHLGIIMLLNLENDAISIKNEHKSGKLINKEACLKIFDQLESWSQICLQFLIDTNRL